MNSATDDLIERLELEVREDDARVAAIEARHKAIDEALQAAWRLCCDQLAAPWRALAEELRRQ